MQRDTHFHLGHTNAAGGRRLINFDSKSPDGCDGECGSLQNR